MPKCVQSRITLGDLQHPQHGLESVLHYVVAKSRSLTGWIREEELPIVLFPVTLEIVTQHCRQIRRHWKQRIGLLSFWFTDHPCVVVCRFADANGLAVEVQIGHG